MKRFMMIAGSLALAACASNAGKNEAPPPPAAESAPIVYAAKPTTNLFAPWLLVRDRDVADARSFDEMVRRLSLPVASDVARVAQKNDEGRSLIVDVWKGTNMGVPPAALKKRTPQLQQAVTLAGEFAANRGEQARIIVSVSDADKPSVRKWLESGLAKGRGKFPTELQWKPLKKGDLPFVRIEPADPQYAFGPFSK